MDGEGGADRGARIVRRGRDEEIGELAGFLDHFIGDAIESDAAGEAQIVERHQAFDAAYQRHDRGVRRLLKRGCDIAMPLLERIILVARRTEQRHDLVVTLRRHAEKALGDAEVLLLGAEDRLKLFAEDGGIAVSRQSHGSSTHRNARSRDNRRTLPTGSPWNADSRRSRLP